METKEILSRSTEPKLSLAYMRELVRKTMLEANLIIRGVMSPSAMRAPARRKSGIASRVKESTPTTMRCAMTSTGSVDSTRR